MRIGFIGSGSITKAVVTGLCASDADIESIGLSPRNAEIAAALAGLDASVSVCRDNQHVLDSADIVCVAVVPTIAPDVLNALTFRPDQTIISFVAGMTVDALTPLIGVEAHVVRAIPLPASAQGNGSTVIYPPNAKAAAVFTAIGAAVEVTDEQHFDAFSAVTGTMSTYYAFVEAQAQWLVAKGIPYDKARAFLAGYFVGLARMAQDANTPFADLSDACTTEGGLNEQVHRELQSNGVFDEIGVALDNVWKRLSA